MNDLEIGKLYESKYNKVYMYKFLRKEGEYYIFKSIDKCKFREGNELKISVHDLRNFKGIYDD